MAKETPVPKSPSMEERAKQRLAELPAEIAEVKRKIDEAKEYLRQLDEIHLTKIGELKGLKRLLEETGDAGLHVPQGPTAG